MRIIYLLSISCLMAAVSLAQNVGIGTNTPHPSAGLEVNSNSKGVLFPRVTTAERNAITNPATGLMVFDVEKNLPYYFNGIIWVPLGPISPKDVPPVEITSGSTTGNTTPYSVAISGSYAAAGMTRFDTLGFTDAGAVQIYKKTNGVWAKSQIIIAPDPSANDLFGFSLNMEGGYLVIGNPYKAVLATLNAGKVYVYKLNASTGFFEPDGQFTHPTGLLAQSGFGYSVSITTKSSVANGIAVAVGCPLYATTGNTGRGSASVFRRVGTNNYVHLNTILGTQNDAQLGHTVDIDGNILAMGSPNFDTTIAFVNYSNVGRIQINSFNGTNYAKTDFVLKPIIDTNMYYGYRIALDGEKLLTAGYASKKDLSIYDNYAYPQLYVKVGGSWYEDLIYLNIQNQFNPNINRDLIMGNNMAIGNNYFILGISNEYRFSNSSSADVTVLPQYALIYKVNSRGVYSFLTQVKAPQSNFNTRFGYDVAASGNDYIISMPEGTASDGSKGAVFFGTILE